MPKEFSRVDRVADQIQRELAQMIPREVKDPRLGMITISGVKVSKDMGYADVYISLLTAEELAADSPRVKENLEILDSAAGYLRGVLGKAMKLRMVPRLRFHFDAVLGQGRRMDDLINRAVGKRPAVERAEPAPDKGEESEG